MDKEKKQGTRRMATTSLLLLLIALAAVTATTVAWFSISSRTLVHSMSMDVTAGAALRFDTTAHGEFTEYVETLSVDGIFAKISEQYGFDPYSAKLVPVTTDDGRVFTLRNGTVKEPETGAYLSFTLHFMSTRDMEVHLSSSHSFRGNDGTLISSELAKLPQALRISFTCGDKTVIFDPGATEIDHTSKNILIFGLPQAEDMIYNDTNSLFDIKAETDTPVDIRIWIEGTDEACSDDIRGGDYSIRLRFVGTDENHIAIE
ncbi:MAG: hypothetical protein J5827_04685 [Oscillospiraceae bacterium]|nr:hypothetical protein [Oscillospiraceae bacterium]